MSWVERASWMIAVIVAAYTAYQFGWLDGFDEGADL